MDFLSVSNIGGSRDGMIEYLLRRFASFSFLELILTVNMMVAVFLIEEWVLMKLLLWFSSLKKYLFRVKQKRIYRVISVLKSHRIHLATY